MRISDSISAFAALRNAEQNQQLRQAARRLLSEENYARFIRSYRFMFWFQLIGALAGLLIPSVVLVMITGDIGYLAFGALIGILWICIWLPISLLMPQGRIYREFAKWFRKDPSATAGLDKIFRA